MASDPGSPSRAPVAYTRKLADWRGLLTRNMEGGRDVRKAPLVGPLRFTPNIGEQGKRDRFTGGVRCPTSVADRALAVHAVNETRRRGYVFDRMIALDRLLVECSSCEPKWRPQGDSSLG